MMTFQEVKGQHHNVLQQHFSHPYPAQGVVTEEDRHLKKGAVALLLPPITFYIEFSLDNGHQK